MPTPSAYRPARCSHLRAEFSHIINKQTVIQMQCLSELSLETLNRAATIDSIFQAKI